MTESNQISVVKSNGDRVPFSRQKLVDALMLSGADLAHSEQVATRVQQQIYDGIPTKKIYQLAYSLLRKKRSHRAAGRYRLKKAIFELGPSGYPFEIFVGKLFESFGFKVDVGVMVEGKCVSHEVDVVATRDKTLAIVETKFRTDYAGKTSVQVPLYINSRFNDIREKISNEEKYRDFDIQGFVVTNARFTLDAINYAECVGLGLISWDYPKNESLKYYIDRSGLHPITSLQSLRKTDKQLFLDKGIVLCEQLIAEEPFMIQHGFDKKRINRILNEARMMATV